MKIKIFGEKIQLRTVRKDDAKFILNLRQNKSLNKYISKTSLSLKSQEEWIEQYLIREDKKQEYYFIILNAKTLKECGTVRIYNIDKEEKTCVWGSFILDNTRPDGASYETIKLSLDFIFNNLNLKTVKLDVKKDNQKAIHIYKKSGFLYEYEDLQNEYYFMNKTKRS